MDKQALKKAITEAISEILETMFFMPSEFPDKEGLDDMGNIQPSKLLGATLAYKGVLSGQFMVVIPESMARELTANLLGLEPEEAAIEDIEATVKELLNMVAGRTFSIYDSSSIFELEVPELTPPETILRQDLDQRTELTSIVVETVNDRLGFRLILD